MYPQRIQLTRNALAAILMSSAFVLGGGVGCGAVYPDATTTRQIKAAKSARGEQAVSPGAGLRTTTTNPGLPLDPDKSPKDDTPNNTGPK